MKTLGLIGTQHLEVGLALKYFKQVNSFLAFSIQIKHICVNVVARYEQRGRLIDVLHGQKYQVLTVK